MFQSTLAPVVSNTKKHKRGDGTEADGEATDKAVHKTGETEAQRGSNSNTFEEKILPNSVQLSSSLN